MAKAKHKPSRAQGSLDSKRRKMQHFQRVSMPSSSFAASPWPSSQSAVDQPQRKRKLGDVSHTQEQQQQLWKDKKKKINHQQELHQRPTIPYRKKDRILLLGEGDFSFARSLYEHRRCKNIFATCYDSREDLLAKYHGQAEIHIEKFLDQNDEREESGKNREDTPMVSEAPKETENDDKDNNKDEKAQAQSKMIHHTRKVLYSIDARKLGTSIVGGGKDIRKGIPRKIKKNHFGQFQRNKPKGLSKGKVAAAEEEDQDVGGGGPWDIISFNFPHVGGLSTDVNRQVRANQELLVAFFKACVPLLSRQSGEEERDDDDDDDDEDEYCFDTEDETPTSSSEEAGSDDEQRKQQADNIRTVPRTSGQIVVTLFEGEPYTLWNIKDLARHAGLVVVTSFKFPWKSYPGYSHARTLGIVESRSHHKGESDKDGDATRQGGGGWKGEDRDARSYVFEVKRDNRHRRQQQPLASKSNKNKRDREEEDDDESD